MLRVLRLTAPPAPSVTLIVPLTTAVGDYSKLTKKYAEDSDATPQTWFQFFNGSNVNQESGELRLNGGNDKLNWTTGAYALRIDGNYYEGWDGNFNYQANQFVSPSNPGGAWPYPACPAPTAASPRRQNLTVS